MSHLNDPLRETHEVMKRHADNGGADRHGDILLAQNGRLTQGFDSAIYNSAQVQRPSGFLALYRMASQNNDRTAAQKLDRYEFLPGNGYGEEHKGLFSHSYNVCIWNLRYQPNSTA